MPLDIVIVVFCCNFVKSQAEMPQKELTIAERVVVLTKLESNLQTLAIAS